MSALTILHVAPHPDDEVLGAGATLIGLREAGHRVVNLAAGLGRRADHARRRAELEEAGRRAGFEVWVHDPPLDISLGDDLELAQRLLTRAVADALARSGASLVVSPSPHDAHHGHEVVARAVHAAATETGVRWWMWGLWADLPFPTLVVPFDDARLGRVHEVLAAYTGELRRNDYEALLPARATVNRILGVERAFGYGHSGLAAPYADVLTEALPAAGGGWCRAAPRVLAAEAMADPLSGAEPGPSLEAWLAMLGPPA